MACNAGPDIIEDGLVLCLDAGNKLSYPGTGTTWSDLAGDLDVTLYNSVSFSQESTGVLAFDGSDEYCASSVSSPDYGLTSYSISFWYKSSVSLTQNNNFYIIDNRGTGVNTYFAHWFRVYSNNVYIGTSINRGSNIASNSPVVVSTVSDTLNWNNFCVTYDNSSHDVKYYTNGNYKGVWQPGNFGSTPGDNNSQFVIGNTLLASQSLYKIYGKLSSFLVYNRSLTSDEIKRNHEATAGRFV